MNCLPVSSICQNITNIVFLLLFPQQNLWSLLFLLFLLILYCTLNMLIQLFSDCQYLNPAANTVSSGKKKKECCWVHLFNYFYLIFPRKQDKCIYQIYLLNSIEIILPSQTNKSWKRRCLKDKKILWVLATSNRKYKLVSAMKKTCGS